VTRFQLIYWVFIAASLWQRQCSPEKPQMKVGEVSSRHWTIIVKLLIKCINCFEWRRPSCLKMGKKPPLCGHNNSCFGKEQHCFYELSYTQSSFVSHLVFNRCVSRNSATLAHSGRVRTNLHHLL
jgi:hypothetical protein